MFGITPSTGLGTTFRPSGDAFNPRPLLVAENDPPDRVVLQATPYDDRAGAHAGVQVVTLHCGGWGDADLGGAIAVYDGPRTSSSVTMSRCSHGTK